MHVKQQILTTCVFQWKKQQHQRQQQQHQQQHWQQHQQNTQTVDLMTHTS